MTNKYIIIANGVFVGEYTAHDVEGAILSHARMAGYSSIQEAADIFGKSPEAFMAEYNVTEYSDAIL